MPPRQPPAEAAGAGGLGGVLGSVLTGGGGKRESPIEALAKSAARSLGPAIVRGVLGSILKR
jgi:hypothetical protein